MSFSAVAGYLSFSQHSTTCPLVELTLPLDRLERPGDFIISMIRKHICSRDHIESFRGPPRDGSTSLLVLGGVVISPLLMTHFVPRLERWTSLDSL